MTFLAGVYGMNFHYMPELDSEWGYPFTLASMVGVAIIMIIFMRMKKWF
jgi:magnesium transporter